jgi:mxaK protein
VVLNPRRLTRGAWFFSALLLVLAGVEATLLWRTERLNQVLNAGGVPEGSAAQLPESQFAQAFAHAASAADAAALDRYRALQGDSALGQAARYNSANVLLRQAMRLRDSGQPGQAVPLIELAKETYRELLRDEPTHWDARYNLERAQRLLPDAAEDDSSGAAAPQQAERAATTMRGVSPGLP